MGCEYANDLAASYNNLGALLQSTGKPEEAVAVRLTYWLIARPEKSCAQVIVWRVLSLTSKAPSINVMEYLSDEAVAVMGYLPTTLEGRVEYLQKFSEDVIRRMLRICGLHNYRPGDLQEALAFLAEIPAHSVSRSLVESSFPLSEIDRAVEAANTRDHLRVAITPSG